MGRRRIPISKQDGEGKTWRTALYVRLSKDDGHSESYSVRNQRERLLQYISASPNEFELVDTYIDDGFTGTDSARVSFQNMLKDIESGRINCVIVKDPSRLSRNYIEAGHYLEHLFIELNVRFISLELPALDSLKKPELVNSMTMRIQHLFNDDFARSTSEKVCNTLKWKRENGQFVGAWTPYGYEKSPENKHNLVVDNTAAAVVRNIFLWYVVDGLGKRSITIKLNNMGVPNPATYKRMKGCNYGHPHANNNGMWDLRTVSTILQNRMYLGHMVQGKKKVKSYKIHTVVAIPKEDWVVVENTHEPIIDQETFDRAQELQSRDTRTSPIGNQLHTFSGFIKCADCKAGMTRTTAKGHVYYSCRTYMFQSKDRCTKHSIKEDWLEQVVLEAIKKQIALIENLQEMVCEINQIPCICKSSQFVDEILEKRKQELAQKVEILDSLYLDLKSDILSQTQYIRMKGKLENQIEHIESAILQLEEEQITALQGVKDNNSYFTTFLKYKNIEKIDRSVLVALVDTVYIFEDKSIKINFNFADQHRRVLSFIENNTQHNLYVS